MATHITVTMPMDTKLFSWGRHVRTLGFFATPSSEKSSLHHHRVDDVGVSDEAAIEKAEPRGHDEDQRSGGQHPCNRASADEVFREFDGHHGSMLLTSEEPLRQPKEPLLADIGGTQLQNTAPKTPERSCKRALLPCSRSGRALLKDRRWHPRCRSQGRLCSEGSTGSITRSLVFRPLKQAAMSSTAFSITSSWRRPPSCSSTASMANLGACFSASSLLRKEFPSLMHLV